MGEGHPQIKKYTACKKIRTMHNTRDQKIITIIKSPVETINTVAKKSVKTTDVIFDISH